MWAEITEFAPIIYPGILLTGIENGGHWPWPQGHLAISTPNSKKKALNVALVYWSRAAKGCFNDSSNAEQSPHKCFKIYNPLQWHHIKIMASQITVCSTFSSTVYAGFRTQPYCLLVICDRNHLAPPRGIPSLRASKSLLVITSSWSVRRISIEVE